MCFEANRLIRVSAGILLALVCNVSFALDLSPFKETCADLGFQPGTEKFGNCVLKLYERDKSKPTQKPTVQAKPKVRGDGSADDRACQKYGFKPGEGDYSNCRMQIDMARRQAQEEQRRYDAQIAEVEAEKRRARGAAMLSLGLGMMSGNTGRSTSSIPMPPPPPLRRTIVLPGGQMMTCNTAANVTSCF